MITTTSRNRREGGYIGNHRGRCLRSTDPLFCVGVPDADVAWALASRRAGVLLALCQPRHTINGEGAAP